MPLSSPSMPIDASAIGGHKNNNTSSSSTDGAANLARETREETQRKEKALATLKYLRWIQLGLCCIGLGGYARVTATALNATSPGTLDDAFSGELDYTIAISAGLALLTIICIAIDYRYFTAYTKRNEFDFDIKQNMLTKVKNEHSDEKRRSITDALSSSESKRILTTTRDNTRTNINSNPDKIKNIINNDIYVRQLLILCDVHRDTLLKDYDIALEQERKGICVKHCTGECTHEKYKADILKLIKKHSKNVSLKDYTYSHKSNQTRARLIEYVQALKIPLRFSSILLILEGRAFNCPDIFQSDDSFPAVMQWILIFGMALWILNMIAYRLEFNRNDTNSEYDRNIRKYSRTHHNALLATLFLSLDRKIKSNETPTTPQENIPETLFWGREFTVVIWWKMWISGFVLGPLGRRPWTIFALSGEEVTLLAQLCVGSAVLVLVLADLYYMRLSMIEETWKLKNQEDQKLVLSACAENQKDEKYNPLKNITTLEQYDPNATADEKALFNELKRSDKNASPMNFKESSEENAKLAQFQELIDKALWLKFALRALSLGFSIPQFIGTDLHEMDLGPLRGNIILMLVAGIIGGCLGYMLQAINAERDKRLKPSTADKESQPTYTKDIALFFREPRSEHSAFNRAKTQDKKNN